MIPFATRVCEHNPTPKACNLFCIMNIRTSLNAIDHALSVAHDLSDPYGYLCIAITSIKETITEVKEGVEKLSLTAGRETDLEVQLEEAVKEKKEALYEGDVLKKQLVTLMEERDNMMREVQLQAQPTPGSKRRSIGDPRAKDAELESPTAEGDVSGPVFAPPPPMPSIPTVHRQVLNMILLPLPMNEFVWRKQMRELLEKKGTDEAALIRLLDKEAMGPTPPTNGFAEWPCFFGHVNAKSAGYDKTDSTRHTPASCKYCKGDTSTKVCGELRFAAGVSPPFQRDNKRRILESSYNADVGSGLGGYRWRWVKHE